MPKIILPVIIRYEGAGRANRRDWHLNNIVAFFPTEPGTNDPYTMSCYSSIGQHSTCVSYYIGRKTKPATPAQVRAMLAELRRHPGYKDIKLRVIKRVSPTHVKQRREALKKD